MTDSELNQYVEGQVQQYMVDQWWNVLPAGPYNTVDMGIRFQIERNMSMIQREPFHYGETEINEVDNNL
jgi:hypothetical protein